MSDQEELDSLSDGDFSSLETSEDESEKMEDQQGLKRAGTASKEQATPARSRSSGKSCTRSLFDQGHQRVISRGRSRSALSEVCSAPSKKGNFYGKRKVASSNTPPSRSDSPSRLTLLENVSPTRLESPNSASDVSDKPSDNQHYTSRFEAEVRSTLGVMTDLLNTVVKRVESVENEVQQLKLRRTCSSSDSCVTPAKTKTKIPLIIRVRLI